MSTEVRVPSTGNSGEPAVVLDVLVAVGQRVAAGEAVAQLETAKATVDVEAPVGGVVLRIDAAEGQEVAEHAVLAVVGDLGERQAVGEATPPKEDDVAASETAAQSASTAPRDASVAGTTSHPAVNSRGRIKASPRASILAERGGIDLSTLIGSGPGGRIIVSDVLAARDRSAAPATSGRTSAKPEPSAAETPEFELIPVRGARKITAQRMQDSLQSSAQVTLTRYAAADRLMAYAGRLKEAAAALGKQRIGVNDLLLFAAARAFAGHPEGNAHFGWDGIRRYRQVNLGFAVDTGSALLVPVIPGAETLSLGALAEAAHAAIERAESGRILPQEMEEGTVTVTNLGGLGIHWFTPVLNPPQACILGVGAVHQAGDSAPKQLPLSLTFDHRALDGASAAALLADVATTIENIDILAAY